jgi:hypothetical protein
MRDLQKHCELSISLSLAAFGAQPAFKKLKLVSGDAWTSEQLVLIAQRKR